MGKTNIKTRLELTLPSLDVPYMSFTLLVSSRLKLIFKQNILPAPTSNKQKHSAPDLSTLRPEFFLKIPRGFAEGTEDALRVACAVDDVSWESEGEMAAELV